MTEQPQFDSEREPFDWTRSDVEAALPAFLVGALEEDEMLVVDAFLERDSDLRRRADELQTTVVDMLAFAPQAETPPAGLSERILTRVHAAAGQPPAVAPASLPTSPRQARRPGFGSRVRAWWRLNSAPAAFGFGAALLLLLVASYLLQMQGQIGGLRDQLAAATSENRALRQANTELQEINETLRTRVLEQDRQFASFTAADTVLTLSGTESAPNASAIFALTGKQATLIAADLPPIDASQTYQLWLIPAEGEPVPAGLLAAQPDAGGTWVTPVPLTAGEFQGVGLSIEPAAGSPTPTGPIVLLGGDL